MKKRGRPYKQRRQGPGRGRPSGPRVPFVPRVSRQLRPILREVGAPEDRPFTPDPYQIEALELLKEGDVVVSAPTGAGKTYIALEAMAELAARGGRVWYASPLKALSNAKFLEFGRRFGTNLVGLLTGDHKVNPDAPLIVGTTEILRNQLYDVMHRGQSLSSDLVVMDEAHYLGDPDRGVVWEEVAIYLPARVRLLLLSATVDNAGEIADWLSFIRKQKARTVVSRERPVPLHPLFLFPDGELVSLDKNQSLSPRVRHFIQKHPSRGPRGGRGPASLARVLKVLGQADLLPAIFFLKSRADCDQALSRCFSAAEYLDSGLRPRLDQRLDEFLEKYPSLKTHPHLKYIRGPGVAAHHAGHMPHWKLLIEHLMQEGLLAAIFSTSTVAAGVNFPARSVVICQSDRFNGREFVDLTATDLLQMTGRAGRRGMDRIGFALVVPGPFQDPGLIHQLFSASPEPVVSQIQINFSMVLNLLLSHRPEEIKHLLSLSLAAFQQDRSKTARRADRVMKQLGRIIQDGTCGSPETAINLYRQARRLKEEGTRLARARPRAAWETALGFGLKPGRLFEVYGGGRFCVLENRERRRQAGVLAAKLREDLGLKKGRVRSKWVPLGRISALFDTRLDIDIETLPAEALEMIRAAARREHDYLDPGRLPPERTGTPLSDLEAGAARVRAELEKRPCPKCPLYQDCLGAPDSEAYGLLTRLEGLEAGGWAAGRLLWTSFVRHLEFLEAEGFVGPDGELTEDGRWAAQLRLDHPLLIAAGIRAGAWPEGRPALLAALVAPYVVDKERESEADYQVRLSPDLSPAWRKLDLATAPLVARLRAEGFSTPLLTLSPALAVYAWATGGPWDEAVRIYGQDPGDMAMLVFRTADNLRQMANLKETHPGLAPTARAAVDLIMKEPATTPL